METVIGVFSSRERAAEAVRELVNRKVPQESIVFLTRSETEAKAVGKELGPTAGRAVGLGTGIGIVLLAVTGIGQVFSLGFGPAALLELLDEGASAAKSKSVHDDASAPQPGTDEKCSEDAAFFREVLREGRTLIVVRTESQETATVACGILDRLGLGIQGHAPRKMQTAIRKIGDVAIVDVTGRITLGEGSLRLREIVRELLEKGNNKILLNLHDVGYVDSSGVGELVKTYTTVRNQGGQLTLLNPSKRVSDLLHITRLASVFDIEFEEASAIQSLNRPKGSRTPA